MIIPTIQDALVACELAKLEATTLWTPTVRPEALRPRAILTGLCDNEGCTGSVAVRYVAGAAKELSDEAIGLCYVCDRRWRA